MPDHKSNAVPIWESNGIKQSEVTEAIRFLDTLAAKVDFDTREIITALATDLKTYTKHEVPGKKLSATA